ncbi:thiosulfate:glutathione sulfurtransferase [Denticeps clupeoides]|uniref:Rhodanese domain-containing protein n=1 Tax=Denticeps clupeoides TaxID=299321 RepID=A0AAY4AUW8_9TELE|nr:thiosulfate:glutathione sulfurtransferase-like [Denticeps clupeoides]
MLSCALLRRLCFSAGKAACSGPVRPGGQRCGLRTSAARCGDVPPDPASIVTYEELKSLLSSRSVQLFDVRNPDEFQAGRIQGAVNIPLDTLEQSLKLAPQRFELQFKAKAPGKDDYDIVFHCQRGRRSATALEIAWGLGFKRARHYAGGYSEWEAREKK